MNRLEKFILRRIVMHKIKAFFGSIVTPKNSETWMFWGGIVAKLACFVSPAVCAVLNDLGSAVGIAPDVAVGSALVYAVGRMTSKAVKAEAPAK